MPVAVKDNVDVAGQLTPHGTGAVARAPANDYEVVRRLRAAGALIVGKTNMSELAAWGHMTETAAWGVTRNPWAPDRSPGGSSGGSAAAVAAGLVPAALGSDGGGSIRVPSAFCALFGLKPQRGRISMAPDADHWHGLTVFGGIACSVLDAALFDDVIVGPAAGDRHRAPPLPAPSPRPRRGSRRRRGRRLLHRSGRRRTARSPRPPSSFALSGTACRRPGPATESWQRRYCRARLHQGAPRARGA